MEKGTLVEFRTGSDRRLGVIEKPDGKKNFIALDERGHGHSLQPRQISYALPGSYRHTEIATFMAKVEPLLDPDSLEVAWELLEGASAGIEELATLLFSDTSPEYLYATHCLLTEDKLYFKQKGDRYEPRSASQVAEQKHQAGAAQQRQQEWNEFVERLDRTLAQAKSAPGNSAPGDLAGAVDSAQKVEWTSTDRPRLDALERFATLGEDANNRTLALEILQQLKRPETPQGAFALLVDLGLWNPHENLFLRRAQAPVQFPAKVLDVVHPLLTAPPVDPNPRLDLTHLKVYTIDDESTKEIDDGLSVEFLPGDRQRLWIHIADPSRWISLGDELDLEARRRSTTIYLPTGSIPMFPPALATGPMSLVQGQVGCALSFGVILDPTGAVMEYQIHTSQIKTTYRLTYDDVDEMLELQVQGERELQVLSQSAKLRQAWRQSQGSISIHMPESSIKVNGEEINIDLLDDSQSRNLVAEMMILAGEVAARYAQQHEIPVAFRAQPQPELPPEEELQQLPAGPVRFCAIRRCMPRSEISITPGRHSSLGLEMYTQVTSPIRRYSDLLGHFQLKAHLRGDELPFSPNQMQEMLLSLGSTVQEAVMVERQTNRYWSLEYLRRHSGEVWQAMLLRWLREHEGLGLVLLEDLGLELAMRFNRPIELGDRLELQVSHVDPRQDLIYFQEVQPSQVSS
jgi:exoribonuclease II